MTNNLTKLKEDPELFAKLEAEIKAISGAVRRMLAGPLNRRAIVVLLNDLLPQNVGISDIKAVLDAIENLDTQYLKKKIKGL